MLVEIKLLDKLKPNFEGMLKYADALWELAYIINSTTIHKDRKHALQYCMQQIKRHQLGLILIKEVIEAILQENSHATH